LLTACGSSSSNDDDDTAGDDDDTTSDDDDTAGDDDDATPPPQGSLTGRVVDLAGGPLAGIGVSCCSEQTCLTGTTGTDGSFLIEGLSANTYVVDNLGYPGDDAQVSAMAWGKFFEFVTIGPDEAVTLEHELVLPEVAEPQQVNAGSNTLAYAGGLEVSFDGSAISLPFIVGHFTDDDDEDGIANYLDEDANSAFKVGAVELPSSAWPRGGLDDGAGSSYEIKEAWAFAPFETALEDGSFSVALTLAEAPPAGTSLYLMWADYEDGIEREHFQTVASDLNGQTVTAEVPKLSVLMLVAASN
jgi:hypothetical protein